MSSTHGRKSAAVEEVARENTENTPALLTPEALKIRRSCRGEAKGCVWLGLGVGWVCKGETKAERQRQMTTHSVFTCLGDVPASPGEGWGSGFCCLLHSQHERGSCRAWAVSSLLWPPFEALWQVTDKIPHTVGLP